MKSEIFQLGEELTSCPAKCSGVRNEPENGIVPRGLIYEDRSGNGYGVVVVGLNPGVAKPAENEYRLKNGVNYQSVINCWSDKIYKSIYFSRPRKLIEELGFTGDILWTNIAKCECLDSAIGISFSSSPQTFRFCAGKYLKRELEVGKIPSWPIIACGKDAFTALSYLFTERMIIGIPHPSGAGIEYRKLLNDQGKLKENLKNTCKEFFAKKSNGAFWLSCKAGEVH